MKTILTIQGFFYVLTGIWPLLHMRSFELVTGNKRDRWLVNCVGILVTCSGVVLLLSTIRPEVIFETIILATSNAFALACIDIYYVYRKVIRKIYLADAMAEVGLLCAYAVAWPK